MKLYAFWPYDLFPYTCFSPIESLTDTSIETGTFGTILRTASVVIVPRGVGAKLAEELRSLETDYKEAKDKLEQSYDYQLDALFASYKVARPK